MSNCDINTDDATIRATQAFVYRLYQAGRIAVPIHFAFGHEQVASKVVNIVDGPRCLFLPHRNIHIQIACCLKHTVRTSVMLGQYLDAVTLSEDFDRGGSVGAMNFVFGGQEGYTTSILANQLGVAIGASLAFLGKEPTNKRIVVVLGDGAIEEGRFWESLIFIKTHCLPIDIVVENNGWSMQSSIDQRRCSINLSGVADLFGLDYVSGNRDQLPSIDSGLPRIIEFVIETLGSTVAVDRDNGSEKIINYHSGQLLDLIERRHYSDFFEISPIDKLTRASITSDFRKRFETLISPFTEKYGVEGFI